MLLGPLLVLLLLGGAGPASAHAALGSTDPADGTVLQRAPGHVTLTFSESVGLRDDSFRVLDPGGHRVRTGAAGHADGRSDTAGVALPDGLGEGTYTVAWRVVSADSHPVSGAFTFSVGKPSQTSAPVDTGPTEDPLTAGLHQLARYLAYLAAALLIGTAAFVALCRPPDPAPLRRPLVAGWWTLLAATVTLLVLRAPYEAGTGPSSALDAAALADTLTARPGVLLLIRLALLAPVALFLVRASRADRRGAHPPRRRGGHRPGRRPRPDLGRRGTRLRRYPGAPRDDVLHPAPARHRGLAGRPHRPDPHPARLRGRRHRHPLLPCRLLLRDRPGDHRRLSVLARPRLLAGAHRNDVRQTAAGQGAPGGRAAGRGGGVPEVDDGPGDGACRRTRARPRARADTATGRRPTPEPPRPPRPPDAGTGTEPALRRGLYRSVLVEAIVAAVVLGVTTVLTATLPGRAADEAARTAVPAGGVLPASVTTIPFEIGASGRSTVQITLDPGRTGDNAVQAVVFGPDGSLAAVPELRLSFTLPDKDVGPIEADLVDRGGYWSANTVTLPLPGTWTMRATVRVSEIDQVSETRRIRVER